MAKDNAKMADDGAKDNPIPVAVGAIIVIIVIIGIFYLLLASRQGTTTTTATTTNPPLTTQTVSSLTTTIVRNLTTAVGPNLATCNGYNYSISQASFSSAGSCGWIGGLINITVWGGSYNNVLVALVQQNTTLTPFNATYSAAPCAKQSNVYSIPRGNYKVTFSVGSVSGCTPAGPASMRMSH